MEQLPRLHARIASLRELRDLIKALRALAATHVLEAQAALPGMRQYVDVIEDSIAAGAALLARTDMAAQSPVPSKAGVLIVICSERGFVGAFNERLLDRAEAERKAGQDLFVIGQRGAALAAERKLRIEQDFPLATRVSGVLAVARRVADRLAGVSTADAVFGRYQKGGNYEVAVKRILPLDPSLLVRADNQSPPLHQLAPRLLLQRLAEEYLFSEIAHALMESLASENGARLRVMERADHNIGDKLEEMQRKEHALRQEVITAELLDVVTGSEAIFGAAGG